MTKKKVKVRLKAKSYLILIIFIFSMITIIGTHMKTEAKEENYSKKEVELKVRKEKVVIDKEEEKDPLEEKLNYLENINEKLDFFKEEYIDRYISYKEKHPNYKTETVIVDVNIGFDYDYYENITEVEDLNSPYLLVNKYHNLPSTYVPNDLQPISSEYAVDGMRLVGYAKEAFEEMAASAKEEGYTIRAMSSYRSYDYQQNLYNRYVKEDGVAKADTYSARAGHSEHQTGLAVDIDNRKTNYTNFESTKEYEWMQEHAHEYGFIMRYPKNKVGVTGYQYESWHYRYVGVDIATAIHNSGMSYDEYYVRYIEGKTH